MPRIHSHLPREGSAFGSVGQHAAYGKAVALYRRDRLDAAYDAMLELGTGSTGEAIPTFRMIEAEFLTRRRAEVRELSPVLRIECAPSDVDAGLVERVLLRAREEAASRLGLVWDSIVHATILDESANAPWAPFRHGYCSPKEGFAKICLPHYLLRDEGELESAFRHELTHALGYQEADLACAEWLHEAAAMRIGGEPIGPARRHFRAHPEDWKDPDRLSEAFNAPRSTESEQRRAMAAYWQAALIGAHMAETRGEASLGAAFKAHRLGFVEQLRSTFFGASPTRLAVKKVYGVALEELFAQAAPQASGSSTAECC